MSCGVTVLERIPPLVHEFSIIARREEQLGTARAVLLAAGVAREKLAQGDAAGGIHCLKVFSEDAIQNQKLNKLFRKLDLPGVKTASSVLRPRDWLTRWKVNWKPARLTKQLDVVPLWCKDRYHPKKGREYILMDTLLSFGTGLHETTRFVSQFIEDKRGQFASFMDIGTGTGILGMVALKHGARQVLAIDIGDLSVQAARHNFKTNRLKAVVRKADIKTFRQARRYDLVAANLVTQDLIDNRARILRFVKPGGYLAVSGISLDNLVRFRRVFNGAPLECLQIKKGRQWAGLLYAKKMS